MTEPREHRSPPSYIVALCALALSCGAPSERAASTQRPESARPQILEELPQTWQSPDPALLEEARSQAFGEDVLRKIEEAVALDYPSALVKLRSVAGDRGITTSQASWLRAQADALAPRTMEVLQADFTAACAANDQRAMAAALLVAADLQLGQIDVGECTPGANSRRIDSGAPSPLYWEVIIEGVHSRGPNGVQEFVLRLRNVTEGRDAPYVLRSFGRQAAAFAETAPSLAIIFGGTPRWKQSDLRRAHRWIGAAHIFLLGDGVMTPCANFTAPTPEGVRSNVSVDSPVLLVRKDDEVQVRCVFRASDTSETSRLIVLGAPPTPLTPVSP